MSNRNARALLVAASVLLCFARAPGALAEGRDAYLGFFLRGDLNPAIGLSCATEQECLATCQGGRECLRPVGPCLDCVGARSPEMANFYQNAGTGVSACHEQRLVPELVPELFRALELIPLSPSSPYNPLSLKDASLEARFRSLCPAGSGDAVALAVVDRATRAVQSIPLVACGRELYPLAGLTDDCVKKSVELQDGIFRAARQQDRIDAAFAAARARSERLAFDYEVVAFSEFHEFQYLRCDAESRPVCQVLCESGLSCSLPVDGERNARGVLRFGSARWRACDREAFSVDLLLRYLGSERSFAFTSRSLAQRYDSDPEEGAYDDFSVIDRILAEFRGVFRPDGEWSAQDYRGFLVSPAYRESIAREMRKLCGDGAEPVVLGTGDSVERVFCRSGLNGYFHPLIRDGERCPGGKGEP
ncbi:MAG: hypothetical protein NDJ89_04620 [Oligoflexia bacterium]|nr:hypothetical protein [Oligoflexia bacterium]